MIFLEANLDGLVVMIFAIMFLPTIILCIIGAILLANKKKKAGKILIIIGVVYAIVSLGICGSMMA